MELLGHFDEGECFAVKSLGSGYTRYMIIHVLPQGQTRMCISVAGATKSFGPTIRVYPLSQTRFLKEERDEELARNDRKTAAPNYRETLGRHKELFKTVETGSW